MITEDGSLNSHVWDDGWTVVTNTGARCAQFEQTLLVTDDGVEILTWVLCMYHVCAKRCSVDLRVPHDESKTLYNSCTFGIYNNNSILLNF